MFSTITAKVPISGHQSESFDIKCGYKQGDALSCAFFILGFDLLKRNINRAPIIKIIEIKTKITNRDVKCKAGAYADDVHVL
jgi:hypothetical protein